ncbi:Sucrase/ferredoxin-like family protein [Prunus dulcis]|uniref:Sucrase/ferredoxin-like family protein n=1 Tax=Prunus dulcis TaxID=3755 RepID=A0A4Y1RKJ2_PRUDU|nr:Sucrase/ferredoxin-like family protein [Prunus dulcis]
MEYHQQKRHTAPQRDSNNKCTCRNLPFGDPSLTESPSHSPLPIPLELLQPLKNSSSVPTAMASARDRDDSLTFTNPSTSSSPIIISDPFDSFLSDPNSHIGSASGSFQNEGLLADTSSDAEFGFSRPEFRTSQLAGTVEFYQRHVFLCYKNPQVWPPRIEAAEFDRLPRLLYAAVMARRGDMKKESVEMGFICFVDCLFLEGYFQTRLTICEGHDGTETSNGDVLIFPDMIRYRRLTHFDVDTFVEEVLVKDGEWLPGTPETLKGSYVFVCSHGSRDRRCGVCGPPLITRFREEIELHGLQGMDMLLQKMYLYCLSSISGKEKFWTGYGGWLLKQFFHDSESDYLCAGSIVGQMGLSEEQQKKSQELRLHLNGETNVGKSATELTQPKEREMNTSVCRSQVEIGGCCQENRNSSCCQNAVFIEKLNSPDLNEMAAKETTDKKKSSRKLLSGINSGKGASKRKVCAMPTWFQSWEREDTYAAFAVVCAAVSVGIAYSCYKQLR